MANLVKWNKDATAQPDFPAAPNDTWVVRNLYHSWLGVYQDAFFENNEPHIHFVRDSSRDLVTYPNTQWTNYNHWIHNSLFLFEQHVKQEPNFLLLANSLLLVLMVLLE
jgi:hypothetical protein